MITLKHRLSRPGVSLMLLGIILLFTVSCAKAQPPAPQPAAPAATGTSGASALKDHMDWKDLDGALKNQGILLLDVRTAEEYASGRIPGAKLLPYDEIAARAQELATLAGTKDRPIVVYCRSGRRSAIAASSLKSLGYTTVADFGGISAWQGSLER